MATSQDYQNQIANMGDMPNYRNVIAQAYETPVLKPLATETQKLEAQYLPTIFDTFNQIGTGASDMSAAAKLSQIGRNLGNLGSSITSNKEISDYYNSQIQDLAGIESQNWSNRLNNLYQLQQMAYQQEAAQRAVEEAAKDRALQRELAQMELNASAASSNAYNDLMSSLYGGDTASTALGASTGSTGDVTGGVTIDTEPTTPGTEFGNRMNKYFDEALYQANKRIEANKAMPWYERFYPQNQLKNMGTGLELGASAISKGVGSLWDWLNK